MIETALYQEHVRLEAFFTSFGEWTMPLRYKNIKQECLATRNHAGLFDVSHMGEIYINGNKAFELVQYLTTNNVLNLIPGKAQYSLMCNQNGGILEDLIIYQRDINDYLLVVNANNRTKDMEWIQSHNHFGAFVKDVSSSYSLLSLQGPKSYAIFLKCIGQAVLPPKPFLFNYITHQKQRILVSRTGYTGEQGLELYLDHQEADPIEIWRSFYHTGQENGLLPAGLAARDILRTEAGFCLYGNDIDEHTSPYESNLGWLVKLNKGPFIGQKRLAQLSLEVPKNKLVGLFSSSRGIARQADVVLDENGHKVGIITSGGYSFYLKKSIAIARIQNPQKYVLKTPFYINHKEHRNGHAFFLKKLPFLMKKK